LVANAAAVHVPSSDRTQVQTDGVPAPQPTKSPACPDPLAFAIQTDPTNVVDDADVML
jgi:hypothetical protein